MMAEFQCNITNMTVNENNIDKWKRMLKIKSTPMPPAYARMIKRYGANNIDEYFDIIKNNIKNNTILQLIHEYEARRDYEMLIDQNKEEKLKQAKIEASKRNITDDIQIRMLSDADEKTAISLYTVFKETMGEDTEKATEHTQDFILKNTMFGIFVEDILAGFVIINDNRTFKIDTSNDEKISTFYIQELLIEPKYRGQKLSKHLLEYCICKCPTDKQYASLMTMPTNNALMKIAESCGFVAQNTPSGDKQHSLLMIKNMDRK